MPSIQEVINTVLDQIQRGRLAETVDTVKCGDPNQPVTGIVTTFLASYEVIETAVALGANLIITHEPTFYNHRDETEWLADDPVYAEKRRLLDDSGIVVWRFHDHWHRHQPDGIDVGVTAALGWEAFVWEGEDSLFTLPETTVGALAEAVKASLGINTVRVVGDLGMACRNVATAVGSPTGAWQMALLARDDIDVLLTGELREWETSEYARDAVAQGRHKAVIVLGHAKSEEPGMAYLAAWLRPLVPGVPITHVPVGDAFAFV